MVTFFTMTTGSTDGGMLRIDGFTGLGLGPMGLETSVPVERTSTEDAECLSCTVLSVGLRVIWASVLQAGSAMIGLVVATGMLTQMVVGSKTLAAKVIFTEETGQGR